METKKTPKTTVEKETTKTAATKTETAKEEPAKKTRTRKTTTKKETAAKKTTAKKTATKKTVAKETAKKEPAKKTTTRKTTAKKEVKVNAYVEYFGKQVEEKEIIARVKKAWTSSGHKVGDIKTMDLYIKPEEAAVYYVINETETGAVAF